MTAAYSRVVLIHLHLEGRVEPLWSPASVVSNTCKCEVSDDSFNLKVKHFLRA